MLNKALLFDSFNAKYLTYQQVADSFIPNEEYYKLIGNDSMLLMGPRGCGKTTLLKMLTPAGLNYWKAPEANEIKTNLGFTAVYVPSDIHWKNQLEFLDKHLENEKEVSERIVDFLISTNVQVSLCKTFTSLIHFNVSEDKEKLILEDTICKALINSWNIEKPISASFDDIELCLYERVRHVNSLINKLGFKQFTNNIIEIFPEYIFTDFFDLIKIGCKIFEKYFGFDETHKWALCFDELEISPKFLQLKLIKYLRSVDQKYFFKLTTTPLFNIENNNITATEDNDFSAIKLWVYDETGVVKWREFCNKLVSTRLKKKLKVDDENIIEKVFGKYNLDDVIKHELDNLSINEKKRIDYNGAFKPGTSKESSVNFLFKYLALIDPTFKKYLIEKKLKNAEDPFASNEDQAKSIFLKYKVDALYRVIFKDRARRKPILHYGIPQIFDLCDGNPRLVIGLVDELLRRSQIIFNNKITAIPYNLQYEIILEISKKHFNHLKNHPDSTIVVGNKEINLAIDILKPIGNFIYSKIIKDDFSKTVPTTFIVDQQMDGKTLSLLDHALYLGAIVYLDPIESISKTGLTGKRFRLSYFLTPLFRIPNRVLSKVSLNGILKDQETNNEQSQFEFK